MSDVKNVKEVLIAVDEIALHLLSGMKLGAFRDFEALWDSFKTDDTFKAKLMAAYMDAGKCGEELVGAGVLDMLELAQVEVSYVPRFIAALKDLHTAKALADASETVAETAQTV